MVAAQAAVMVLAGDVGSFDGANWGGGPLPIIAPASCRKGVCNTKEREVHPQLSYLST